MQSNTKLLQYTAYNITSYVRRRGIYQIYDLFYLYNVQTKYNPVSSIRMLLYPLEQSYFLIIRMYKTCQSCRQPLVRLVNVWRQQYVVTDGGYIPFKLL